MKRRIMQNIFSKQFINVSQVNEFFKEQLFIHFSKYTTTNTLHYYIRVILCYEHFFLYLFVFFFISLIKRAWLFFLAHSLSFFCAWQKAYYIINSCKKRKKKENETHINLSIWMNNTYYDFHPLAQITIYHAEYSRALLLHPYQNTSTLLVFFFTSPFVEFYHHILNLWIERISLDSHKASIILNTSNNTIDIATW